MNIRRLVSVLHGGGTMKRILILLCIIIIVLEIALFLPKSISTMRSPADVHYARVDPKAEQQALQRIIEEQGVRAAYAFFIDNFNAYDPDMRHYVGHFLGDMLYGREGIGGVGVCQSYIEFGCIHGLVIAGVHAEGKAFMDRAIAACMELSQDDAVNACIHGVSHTFLVQRGYKLEDILSALGDCDLLVGPEKAPVCYNGIFMEYHQPMEDGSVSGVWVRIKSFDPNDPFDPCDKVPAAAQSSCYLDLGGWWSSALPRQFDRMGKLCARVAEEASRVQCFHGVGRSMADVYKHQDKAIGEACARMPSVGVNDCIQGAGLVLINSNRYEGAVALCDFVYSGEKVACREELSAIACRRFHVLCPSQ